MNDNIAKKMGQRPKVQIFFSTVLGLVVAVYGFIIRQDLLVWEETGGEKLLPRFIYWIYSLVGATGVALAFLAGSMIFFVNSYRIFKKLKA
ncbi:TPA: hypothetical protein U0431_001698 [Streptococcus suis]|nr:hypothetical protein [Streptococcus suis]HEM2548906.1 hypothetical protein [Streptococcus suis]